jgi:phage terminase small subunit
MKHIKENSMKRRPGRPSAEAKAALTLIDVSHFRPDAPDELTPEQRQTWKDVVGSMKPGSFPPSTYALLVQYCICVSRCRFIELQLRKITDIRKNLKEFRMWASMSRNETNTLCQLATKLRMLPKTNTRADRQAATETATPWNIRRKPWQDDPNDDDNDQPAA